MKNKILALFLIVFTAGMVFPKTKVVNAPGNNEVILVGKINFSTDMDRKFLLDTTRTPDNHRNYKDIYVMPFFSENFRYIEPKDIKRISVPVEKKKEIQKFEQQSWAANGDYFFVKYSFIKKTRTIYLKYATLFIGASYHLPVILPLNLKIKVPEGEKFLYIGDFTFTAKGFSFELSGKVEDKLEEAQQALNSVANKEYTLYRANAEKLMPEESENVHAAYELVSTDLSKWYKLFKDLPLLEEKE